MAIPKEPDSHRLKKYEELYALTKSGLELEQARFDLIETKVSRYLAVLGIILGASALGLDEFAKVARRASTFAQCAFLLMYVLLGLVTLTAIVLLLLALRFQTMKVPPMRKELLEHFREHRYVDVLYAMSKRYLEATRESRLVNVRKLRKAVFGYRCTMAVVLLVAIVSVLYVLVSIRVRT